MKRLEWLELWDKLREKLNERTSWGRTQVLDLMDELERKAVREAEESDDKG